MGKKLPPIDREGLAAQARNVLRDWYYNHKDVDTCGQSREWFVAQANLYTKTKREYRYFMGKILFFLQMKNYEAWNYNFMKHNEELIVLPDGSTRTKPLKNGSEQINAV